MKARISLTILVLAFVISGVDFATADLPGVNNAIGTPATQPSKIFSFGEITPGCLAKDVEEKLQALGFKSRGNDAWEGSILTRSIVIAFLRDADRYKKLCCDANASRWIRFSKGCRACTSRSDSTAKQHA